jgi:putative ABC transport system ATP-binding protein
MSNPFISVSELVKIYETGNIQVKALQSVSLNTNKGEIVVVLGPSGCGKSTLLNIIGGIDDKTSGEVKVDNVIITDLSEKNLTLYRRKDVGFIFQFYNLIPSLTVLENVEISARLIFPKVDALNRSIDMLERVDLESEINKFPQQLSGGQQQRVAIARALVKEPKVVLADEPTGNLDSKTGQKIIDLMVKISEEKGTTFIIVTHNVSISKLADKIVYLQDGKVLESSSNIS